MEILPFAKNVMSLFLGFTGLLCIGFIIVALGDLRRLGHSRLGTNVVIPFIMFAFGCLLPFSGFKTESENTRYFLEKLLEAKEEVS